MWRETIHTPSACQKPEIEVKVLLDPVVVSQDISKKLEKVVEQATEKTVSELKNKLEPGLKEKIQTKPKTGAAPESKK